MSNEEFVWPCVKCLDGRMHVWHDNGAVNKNDVPKFRKENPVFDKDEEARRDG